MIIKKGSKKIKNNTKKAIIEFELQRYTVFVFKGSISQFDILVQYKTDAGKRLRTPKHIHWVIDILLKLERKNKLTRKFLNFMKNCWNGSEPLTNDTFDYIKAIVEQEYKKINIRKFLKLNRYGEYDVEFLFLLFTLLSRQEKTNYNQAYMFGSVIDKLLEKNLDIFSIIAIATHGGR